MNRWGVMVTEDEEGKSSFSLRSHILYHLVSTEVQPSHLNNHRIKVRERVWCGCVRVKQEQEQELELVLSLDPSHSSS